MVAFRFTMLRGINKNYVRREITKKKFHDAQTKDSEAQLPDQMDKLMLDEARQAFDELPVDQRAALFLIVYDGQSYGEAALALGCNVGTVKSRVSRARAAIAKRLDWEHNAIEGQAGQSKGM